MTFTFVLYRLNVCFVVNIWAYDTALLVKHVSVEHNRGGCPSHLFSNSNCFLRFPIPPVLLSIHRTTYYITIQYISFLLCGPLCIHCATYNINLLEYAKTSPSSAPSLSCSRYPPSISGTKRGIIDALVSKRPEKNLNKKIVFFKSHKMPHITKKPY